MAGLALEGLQVPTRDKEDLSACELCWYYLFGEPDRRPAPFAVRMLGRWDVWDHGAHPAVAPFQHAMRLTEPDYPWQELLEAEEGDLEKLLAEGRGAMKATARLNEILAVRTGTLMWRGIAWAALNSPLAGSLQAAAYAADRPHISGILIFGWNLHRAGWQLSFYAVDGREPGVNLPDLARELDPPREGYTGGGGHARASGCLVGALPFDIEDIIPETL
jgi:hypothetical protein